MAVQKNLNRIIFEIKLIFGIGFEKMGMVMGIGFINL
jgi:hypothetical protein